MNKLMTEEQAAQMNWCDISLVGISWVENGRDVILQLILPSSGSEVDLVCRWAQRLHVALEFGDNSGGSPLSWDAAVKRRDDHAWEIAFDFAGDGSVSLVCQELALNSRD
jgi:hypothetical protein